MKPLDFNNLPPTITINGREIERGSLTDEQAVAEILKMLPSLIGSLQKLNEMGLLPSEEEQQPPYTLEDAQRDFADLDAPPKPKTKYPSTYVYPTDKVTRSLFDGLMEAGAAREVKMGKDRKGPITAKIRVNYDQLAGINFMTRDKTLSQFDQEVVNAVITLNVEGDNWAITPEAVYKIMRGNTRLRPSKEMRQRICESLDMLRLTRFQFNWKELLRYRGFNSDALPDGLAGDTYVLCLDQPINGAYRVIERPMLYKFAACLNQIGRIPLERRRLEGRTSSDLLQIQSYLQRCIDTMKARPEYSRNIRYDTMIKALGLMEPPKPDYDPWEMDKPPEVKPRGETAQKLKRSRIYANVAKILDAWQAEGYIQGYTVNKKGRQYISVTIEPGPV